MNCAVILILVFLIIVVIEVGVIINYKIIITTTVTFVVLTFVVQIYKTYSLYSRISEYGPPQMSPKVTQRSKMTFGVFT